MRSYLIKGYLLLDTKPRAIFVCGDICCWCLPSVCSGLATLITKSCSYCYCCHLQSSAKASGDIPTAFRRKQTGHSCQLGLQPSLLPRLSSVSTWKNLENNLPLKYLTEMQSSLWSDQSTDKQRQRETERHFPLSSHSPPHWTWGGKSQRNIQTCQASTIFKILHSP